MEIPSPVAGVLLELSVKEGDRVSQGSLLAILELDAVAEPPAATPAAAPAPAPSAKVAATPAANPAARPEATPAAAPAAPFESIELDRSTRQLSTAAANPVPDRTGTGRTWRRRSRSSATTPLSTTERG